LERRRAARLNSPMWVEAGVPQPGAVVKNATPSSLKPAAVPTNGDASRPPLHPFGKRTPAATYASFINTNISAYEDFPGHHLILIRNLIASTPDSSYPGSADEGYVFVRDRVAPEWDYSRVRDREAFLSF